MPVLFTIGYEGCSLESVLHTLIVNDVQALVDIRERPQSRKPGFSKKALAAAVEGYGISYLHMRDLGTPRDIRYKRKADHDQVAFEAAYLAHLETQQQALQALIQFASKSRCCLLCFEANARVCHRSLVADQASRATSGGFEVVHLVVIV